MAKERNKAQKMAAELLQHIPFVECSIITSRPFYKDNRTKKVRVCRINDDLWVPVIDLADGSPNSSKIIKLRNTGELTSKDFLPLRTKGFQPCWFISRAAIIRMKEKLEEIIGWDLGKSCLQAILDTITNDEISAEDFVFSPEEAERVCEIYDRRIELLREGKKQEQEQDYDEDDFRDEYLKKMFSVTDEEMQQAMNAMEDIDELAGQIVGLCMDWIKHTDDKGGDWGNGLVMGLTKATSYLLVALERQGKRKKGKPTIIDFYQAMLPVSIDIAKNDIEQKEAAEREKRAKEGYN